MDWDDYYWPGTTVLANKLGHHNQHDLSGEEYIWTAAREELVRNGTAQIQRTFDAEHLRALHGYLFQDVYEWAGDQELLQQMHHSSFPQAERGMSRCVNEAV